MNEQLTSVRTFTSLTSPSIWQCLQKSFHISRPDKIELKKIPYPSENKIYATAKINMTVTVKLNNDNGLKTGWTKTSASNSVLPQLAVICKIESECYSQTFVKVDSEVIQNLQLWQHANHYQQGYANRKPTVTKNQQYA